MSLPQTAKILREDVEKVVLRLRNTSDIDEIDYQSRALIRTMFVYIEGVTFAIKSVIYNDSLRRNIPLEDGEKLFAKEFNYILTNKGEVKEKPAHIRLEDNIQFMFKLHEKVLGLSQKDMEQGNRFNSSDRWWNQLKNSIKVRNRLTHPKKLSDLQVSDNEIVEAIGAFKGFRDVFEYYIKIDLEKYS